MDPLSITTGVLALLGSSITAIQSCQAFAAKYQIAELSISSVRTECSSIRIALLQIQSLISRTPAQDIQDRFQQYVVDEYKAVLGACSLTFALLNERLEGLGLNKPNQRNESEIYTKLRFLWNEAQMDMIRQNIRGQALAVSLLVTAFQSETATKSYELLISQQSKNVLESVCNDAKTLREASLRPRSETDLNTTGSVIGDEEFSFDDIVINSHAYRRAFLVQQRKLEVPLIQEEANTQISNTPISGPSKFRNTPSLEKLNKPQLGRPAYMNHPGGEKRRDEIQSPERSLPWQNSQFLKRIFGKKSSGNNITTAGTDGGKKLPSAKLSTAIKSDLSILRQVQQLEHSWDIWSIALSPDGRLATAGSGGKVLIWETDEQGRLRQVQDLGNYSAYSVAFSPDGRLATAGSGRKVFIWETDEQGRPQQVQVLECNLVYTFDFTTAGSSEKALICTTDHPGQLSPISDLGSHFIRTFAFSSDGRLATFSGNGKVLIWEIGRRRRLQQVQELDCRYVFSAVFSPDGRLATGDIYGNVKIWGADQEGRLQQIQQFKPCELVWSIAFSPDGRLAVSDVYGKVQIWETDQEGGLQQVQQIKLCELAWSIAFSTDGLLAVAGDNGVQIWEADQQRQLQKVQQLEHSSQVWSVTFSPDGGRLAFSDYNGNVLIWEVDQQGRL